jgi:hypothetical protein
MLLIDLPIYTELHLKAAIRESLRVVGRDASQLNWIDPQFLPLPTHLSYRVMIILATRKKLNLGLKPVRSSLPEQRGRCHRKKAGYNPREEKK